MELHQFFIRAVGAPHESWQEEALATYQEKLRAFAKVTMQEIAEGHRGAKSPNLETTRDVEADALLKNLPRSGITIALDENGKQFSSPQFAEQLRTWTDGGSPITFFVGGSWGLDPRVRDAAHATISFGKHTLPHILARIVLLEQLYRAETILRNKTYHK